MKRAYPVIALFLMLFLLVACGPDQPEPVEVVEPTAKPADVLPTVPPADARPTVTPVPSDGYPAPETVAPVDEGYPLMAVTAVPSDYPAVDYTSLPTRNPYPAPGEYIWVAVPMGEQCEDATYPTMQDAIAVLLSNGIATFDWRIDELMVCTACGCPTSTHYLMQILATDLAAAEALGWQESEAPQ